MLYASMVLLVAAVFALLFCDSSEKSTADIQRHFLRRAKRDETSFYRLFPSLPVSSAFDQSNQRRLLRDSSQICETSGCNRAAKLLLSSLNQNADACEDFSKFTCGRFRATHPEPDIRTLIWDDYDADLKNLAQQGLESLFKDIQRGSRSPTPDFSQASELPAVFRQAKVIYDQCLDSSPSPSEALAFIKDFAKWPLLQPGTWNAEEFDIAETVGKLWKKDGVITLFGMVLDVDFTEPTRNMLYIEEARLEHEARYFNTSAEPTFLIGYSALLRGTFRKLVAHETSLSGFWNERKLLKLVDEILDFEREMAAHVSGDDRNKPVPEIGDQKTSLSKFKAEFSSPNRFSWDTYFENAMSSDALDWLKTPGREFVVSSKYYISFLMQKLSTTRKETVANYLFWRLVDDVRPFLGPEYDIDRILEADLESGRDSDPEPLNWPNSKKYRSWNTKDILQSLSMVRNQRRRQKFRRDLQFKTTRTTRGVEIEDMDAKAACLKELEEFFGPVVNYAFVNTAWNDSKQQSAAMNLTNDIRQSILDLLQKNSWLTPLPKSRAMEKIQAMTVNVGYPSWILNLSRIQERYDGLEVSESQTYFANLLAVTRRTVERIWGKLQRAPDKSDMRLPLTAFNAAYVPHLNVLDVPAAVLMYPSFDLGYPSALNYAMAGFTIAHEMFHALDDYGGRFDKDGRLQPDWLLDPASRAEYESRTKCIEEKFNGQCYRFTSEVPATIMSSGFVVFRRRQKEICVNGSATKGENIADLSGIRAAYNAYKIHLNENRTEVDLRLRGLEQFDANQLFFLSYGVGWCSVVSPRFLKVALLIDPHSPEEIRINMASSNMQEFEQYFHCGLKPGSELVSDRKCALF